MAELVELQVPLCRKVLLADEARVWSLSTVALNVRIEGRPEEDTFTDVALDVLVTPVFARYETLIVRLPHVPREARHVYKLLTAVDAGLWFCIMDLLVPSEFFR